VVCRQSQLTIQNEVFRPQSTERLNNFRKCGGKALTHFDCQKMFSCSRKTRQRNPSHFGSYIHSLPSGKVFTTRAFIGDTCHRGNLSFEALDRTGLPLLLSAHENMSPTLRNLQRLELSLNSHLDLRCSNEVSCPVECFEQCLVGRSKVTAITECCFVDSPGGVC
jgi:hypothetical protein